MPGGGLSPDHSHWISSRPHFFLPVKVLSRVFRGKFIAGLRCAFHRDQLRFYGGCLPLTEEKNFVAFLRTLFQQDWLVYDRTTGFLLTALSEPLPETDVSRWRIFRWSASDRVLTSLGHTTVQRGELSAYSHVHRRD